MGKLPVMQGAKWCANCVYWAGAREFDSFFGRAEIDRSCNSKGTCTNMKGFYRQPTLWNTTCNGFTKHPIVKG